MADSSNVNSEDILQQISEQTNQLAEAEPEVEETQVEVQGEQVEEGAEEQPVETSQEETEQEAEAQAETVTPMRIKYKGKEVDIPAEKIREYVQKGYKVEDTLRQLKEKEREITTKAGGNEPFDFSKANEDFVRQLQENPLGTLMQFNKMTYEQVKTEEVRQRKLDRQFEREMSATIPHWNAIADTYHEYRDEGKEPEIAVALAEADFFKNLYLESKQAGVREGVQKATLKQKAVMPSGGKKATVLDQGTPSVDDISRMTSDQILQKHFGGKVYKNPNW
jgi:ribosomal protein S16